MLGLLRFRRLYLLPVIGTLVFYAVPSALGILFRSNGYDAEMLTLSLIAMVTYFLAFHFFWKRTAVEQRLRGMLLHVSWRHFCLVVLLCYFCMIAYAAATAPGIALIASIQGASLDQIAQLRETFLRTRVGAERALLYWYAINISSLMPLVLSILFLKQAKYRYIVLIAFLFTLALTLEKSLSITALIPLIIIFYNSNRRKFVYLIGTALIAAVMVVSFAARGGLSVEQGGTASTGSAAAVPDEYNLFQGSDSQALYVLNRILYIPYASAVDWLRYLDIELKGEPTEGQSIGVIAYLTGRPSLNLEREVFAFEWGQNETQTGSANTVFYIDAYVNFGVTGVILYSALLALLARLCLASRNRAICAGLTVPMIYVCFNSLSAIIFSGGLGILVGLAVLTRFGDSALEWKQTDQFVFGTNPR
ncbi:MULTISPECIES: hypothetical protein [Ralstonia]|uniref:Oligosaccharide repeat unit polymerase n=1 Tax=Ralstonia holmesii TaxID=3058602 RepID=A0ABC8QHP1_9RALS|nr:MULTISPECIES: hypothetical protein [unclassified Ralstonia]CAJ0787570.1 hypothetical protein LMG18096_01984 [Ralstonia sp. LMG 32967]CAJ0808397.1 hypothetical protein LMG18093_00488 [Ralstonia sp. LMG 32967]